MSTCPDCLAAPRSDVPPARVRQDHAEQFAKEAVQCAIAVRGDGTEVVHLKQKVLWLAMIHGQVDQFVECLEGGADINAFYVDDRGAARRGIMWFAGLLDPCRLRSRGPLVDAYIKMFRSALPRADLGATCLPEGEVAKSLSGGSGSVGLCMYRRAKHALGGPHGQTGPKHELALAICDAIWSKMPREIEAAGPE